MNRGGVFQRRCQSHRAATLSNQPMPREHNEVIGHQRDGIDAAQINRSGVRLAQSTNRDREQLNLLQIRQNLDLRLEARIGCEDDWRATAGVRTARRLFLILAFLSRPTAATGDARPATRSLLTVSRTATGLGRTRRRRLVHLRTEQANLAGRTAASDMRHPAPCRQRHEGEDHQWPQEGHFDCPAYQNSTRNDQLTM